MKKDYLKQLDSAIASAPLEGAELTKIREEKLPPKKHLKALQNALRVRTWKITKIMEREHTKLVFQFGPTRYEVWNTRETLIEFRKRIKRAYQ